MAAADVAIDQLQKSQEEARAKMLKLLDERASQISKLEGHLQKREEELSNLNQQNDQEKNEDRMNEVAIHSAGNEKDPRQIPAEEGLDTIYRLENTLKLAQRRNKMQDKENGCEKLLLTHRTQELHQLKSQSDELEIVTGYHPDKRDRNVVELREQVNEMLNLEKTLDEEAKTARVIIRKKEQLVETLIAELQVKRDKSEELNTTYNKIRVKDRDIQQIRANMAELRRDDEQRDGALVVAESNHDHVALQSLEEDKVFLAKQIHTEKEVCNKYGEMSKLQWQRIGQLEDRLQALDAALVDMKLNQQMQVSIDKNALVIESEKEPDDMDRILPKDEKIPLEAYELIRHDVDAVEASLSRKQILFLEKEAALKSLEDKVLKASITHEEHDRQHQLARQRRQKEMGEIQKDLTKKLNDYRGEIDALLRRNMKLRNELERIKSTA